jgi:hypothetical protein
MLITFLAIYNGFSAFLITYFNTTIKHIQKTTANYSKIKKILTLHV